MIPVPAAAEKNTKNAAGSKALRTLKWRMGETEKG
jgi:hypothetical protein